MELEALLKQRNQLEEISAAEKKRADSLREYPVLCFLDLVFFVLIIG
jgi:hypothetical protein